MSESCKWQIFWGGGMWHPLKQRFPNCEVLSILQMCRCLEEGWWFSPGCSSQSSTAPSELSSGPFSHTQMQTASDCTQTDQQMISIIIVWLKDSKISFTDFASRKSMSGRSMLSESTSTWLRLLAFTGPLIWYNRLAICRMQSSMRLWNLQPKMFACVILTQCFSSATHSMSNTDVFPKVLLSSSRTLLSLTCRSFRTSLASVSNCTNNTNTN